MRLPEQHELTCPDHHILYRYDVEEAFSSNPVKRGLLSPLRRIEFCIHRLKKLGQWGRLQTCLDVGCAQGNWALFLAEAGLKVTAVDINENYLGYAKKRYERGDVEYRVGNLETLSIDKKYDLVVLGELLEHVSEPALFLSRVYTCLEENGILVVTTPNQERWLHKVKLPTYDGSRKSVSELKKREFGPAGDDHLFLFTIRELEKLIEQQGFTVLSSDILISLLAKKVFPAIPRGINFFYRFEKVVSKYRSISRRLNDALVVIAQKKVPPVANRP